MKREKSTSIHHEAICQSCRATPSGQRSLGDSTGSRRPRVFGRRIAAVWLLLLVSAAPGCVPSSVIGPLQREQDERDKLLTRWVNRADRAPSRSPAVPAELLDAVFPPPTPEEVQLSQKQNSSCRSSYLWKNGLTWTGSIFVATAAGITVGGAYATGNNDTTGKLLFGVSAGSLAALGSGLVALGGIVQQGFTDRGCWVR
jgi:hypothetical protein